MKALCILFMLVGLSPAFSDAVDDVSTALRAATHPELEREAWYKNFARLQLLLEQEKAREVAVITVSEKADHEEVRLHFTPNGKGRYTLEKMEGVPDPCAVVRCFLDAALRKDVDLLEEMLEDADGASYFIPSLLDGVMDVDLLKTAEVTGKIRYTGPHDVMSYVEVRYQAKGMVLLMEMGLFLSESGWVIEDLENKR